MRTFLLLLTLVGTVTQASTNESVDQSSVALPSNANHFSVGADLNSLAGNFGVGVNVTSPYFLHGHAAVRLSASQNFFRGIPVGQPNEATFQYTTVKLGLFGAGGMVNSLIRLYGGGGFVALIPSQDLSDSNVIAGFGGAGFEFFFGPTNPSAFYIELGAIAGGTAEKVAASPSYAGGFTAAAGTRLYF